MLCILAVFIPAFFMVGAAKAHLARVKPLLDVMGRAVFHVGPPGAGHAMKCLNNLITAINFVGAVTT